MNPQPAAAASQADLRKIARFNSTEAPFPDDATLQQLIEARIDERRPALAVLCDHDLSLGAPSLTYGQVNERANQLAHALSELGVGPGQVVAVMLERSFAMMIALLGIIKAGAAYLPIAPETPPERLDYFLTDAGVRILLTQADPIPRPGFSGRILNLQDCDLYRASTTNPNIINSPHDLAYVIYTSGSTGAPKGVMIEHHSLVNRLAWMQHAYPIGPGDVILQKTPYTFDVSVWELFWWALQGASVCMLPPGGERNPLAIVESVRKHRVTVMHFVPSMLSVFLQYLEAKPAAVAALASVRRVFASGEALTPSHVRRFHDIWGLQTGTQLTNLYGPTEATVDVSYFDCPAHELETVPIGRPIHNTKFYVIRDGAQVPIGEVGELCIAGAGLARGYLNQPALTAEKFTDNPVNPGERIYRTGDLAKWRDDGNVEYLGREDHQVKIRGLRIELGEIEERIRRFPGVADCVVVVRKHSESIVLIVAYVVCGADLRIEALKESLQRFLPGYMIPNRFERIESMPMTSSGKADRKALPAIDLVA
jgi:amino acid adenylation domain-containing protein